MQMTQSSMLPWDGSIIKVASFSFILCLPPINMVHIEKIFSESVLAETFPKPTLVKLLRAKYSDVT